MPTVRFAARARPVAAKPAAAPSAPPAAVCRNVRRDTVDECIELLPGTARGVAKANQVHDLAIAMPASGLTRRRSAIGAMPFKAMKMQKVIRTMGVTPVRQRGAYFLCIASYALRLRCIFTHRFVCNTRAAYAAARRTKR